MELDNKKILLVAVIIGLVLAGIGYWMFNKELKVADAKINILIPKQDIIPYSALDSQEFEVLAVSPDVIDEYTVTSREELVNQVSAVSLFADKPIDKRLLQNISSGNKSNKKIVGVNIDAARSAGVVEGDFVDVLWLVGYADGNNSSPAATENIILAEKAVVIAVWDETGNPVKPALVKKGVATLEKAPGKPHTAFLLVSEEEYKLVSSGSAPNNMNITLAKYVAAEG